MRLVSISSGSLLVNTYFLINDNNQAIIIDSGEDYNLIKQVAKREKIDKIVAILLTHGHFDHMGNIKQFQDEGVKIYISALDSKKLLNNGNLAFSFGKDFIKCIPDEILVEGNLEIAGIKIQVIFTSGHTDGSVTFKVDDMLFTGDTLFCNSCGRTDFPTGSTIEMKKSLKKLFLLDGDYKVYPGHGEFTTLNKERNNNIIGLL